MDWENRLMLWTFFSTMIFYLCLGHWMCLTKSNETPSWPTTCQSQESQRARCWCMHLRLFNTCWTIIGRWLSSSASRMIPTNVGTTKNLDTSNPKFPLLECVSCTWRTIRMVQHFWKLRWFLNLQVTWLQKQTSQIIKTTNKYLVLDLAYLCYSSMCIDFVLIHVAHVCLCVEGVSSLMVV